MANGVRERLGRLKVVWTWEAGQKGMVAVDVVQESRSLFNKGAQMWEARSLERCVTDMVNKMRLVFLGIYD